MDSWQAIRVWLLDVTQNRLSIFSSEIEKTKYEFHGGASAGPMLYQASFHL